ncbi:hypothetical protein ACFV08_18710 [Streptomyces fradiae]|uniref:hypothetical protein n=1 Tax=Streptomyces fradiae TaxID=1906 RepID=UPI0036BEA477
MGLGVRVQRGEDGVHRIGHGDRAGAEGVVLHQLGVDHLHRLRRVPVLLDGRHSATSSAVSASLVAEPARLGGDGSGEAHSVPLRAKHVVKLLFDAADSVEKVLPALAAFNARFQRPWTERSCLHRRRVHRFSGCGSSSRKMVARKHPPTSSMPCRSSSLRTAPRGRRWSSGWSPWRRRRRPTAQPRCAGPPGCS